jgi:hypothetical protein
MINSARSGREFVASFERAAPPGVDLGIVGYKEQYLLYLTRPLTNFGHRRSRAGGDDEAHDAALWLNSAPGRALIVDDRRRAECFSSGAARPLGEANGMNWFLVAPPADASCAGQGDPGAALKYDPPHR